MNVEPQAAPATDVTTEPQEAATELVEVGTVSGTQGSATGIKPDSGVGSTFT